MGVTSRVQSRSISDPLPRTSASLASMAVPLRVRKAGIMKAIGIIAGTPRSHSAIVCRLTYLPKSLTSSAIQVSAEVAPALAGVGAAGVKSLVVVLAIVQLLLHRYRSPLPRPLHAFGMCRMPAQAVTAPPCCLLVGRLCCVVRLESVTPLSGMRHRSRAPLNRMRLDSGAPLRGVVCRILLGQELVVSSAVSARACPAL